MNHEEKDESIGEFYERIPSNEWVEAYGMRFKKVNPPKEDESKVEDNT